MYFRRFIIVATFCLLSISAAEECFHRGDLAIQYCDNNYDLIADTPQNPDEWIDPNPLIISIPPAEDPIAYNESFSDLFQYLELCLDRTVIFYPSHSNEAEVEAMKAGRIHVASFSSGTMISAVNHAGAVPFAAKGDHDGVRSTQLLVLVRADSPYQSLVHLKGSRVAHANKHSITGHLLPLTIFPKEGIIPDEDYQVIFTNKHYLSILGVKSGDYQAAAITSEIFERMIDRQEIKRSDYRIIFEYGPLPASAFSYKNTLMPQLQEELRACFASFNFSKTMRNAYLNTDRFLPVNYKEQWQVPREILRNSPLPDINSKKPF